VIDDLDRTLEELLLRELPRAMVSLEATTKVTITFITPDGQFPPDGVTLPAIDLFLYDVRENRDLKSSEWIVERGNNGQAIKQHAPVRVDCSYLITAWASGQSNRPAQDEHYMLGEVMRVLLRYPTLPPAVLQGSLAGQPIAPPTAVLQPGKLQSVGEFWQALGGRPRAALNYTVTIGVPPQEPVEAGKPVTDSTADVGRIEEPA
jgi:hypothetical protein